MRPGEFWEALRAYNSKVSADRRHLGELVRGGTLRLWNLQVAKKSRITDPAKFWPMPWDELPDDTQEIRRLTNLSEEETQKEVEIFFAKLSGHGSERAENEN